MTDFEFTSCRYRFASAYLRWKHGLTGRKSFWTRREKLRGIRHSCRSFCEICHESVGAVCHVTYTGSLQISKTYPTSRYCTHLLRPHFCSFRERDGDAESPSEMEAFTTLTSTEIWGESEENMIPRKLCPRSLFSLKASRCFYTKRDSRTILFQFFCISFCFGFRHSAFFIRDFKLFFFFNKKL